MRTNEKEENIKKDAVISECGMYRYRLSRVWDESLPRACYVMLNPSVADASIDDPTIRRCIRFAKDQGYGSIEVVNISPLRSTQPDAIRTHKGGKDENTRHLIEVLESGATIVCAWGAYGGLHGPEDGQMTERKVTISDEAREGLKIDMTKEEFQKIDFGTRSRRIRWRMGFGWIVVGLALGLLGLLIDVVVWGR